MPEWNSCFGPACCEDDGGIWLCICNENFLLDLEVNETRCFTTAAACVTCESTGQLVPARVCVTYRIQGGEDQEYEVHVQAEGCGPSGCCDFPIPNLEFTLVDGVDTYFHPELFNPPLTALNMPRVQIGDQAWQYLYQGTHQYIGPTIRAGQFDQFRMDQGEQIDFSIYINCTTYLNWGGTTFIATGQVNHHIINEGSLVAHLHKMCTDHILEDTFKEEYGPNQFTYVYGELKDPQF